MMTKMKRKSNKDKSGNQLNKNRKTTEKTNEMKSWFFKINNIGKPPERQIRG